MLTFTESLFGQIVVQWRMVKEEQVKECLAAQQQDRTNGQSMRPLGQIMMDKGYITESQVQAALDEQKFRSGPRSLSNYYLLEQVGEGGMGSVYKASDRKNEREVALKVLHPKWAREKTFLERFKREAGMGLRLNHPNIIKTYDVGEDRGYHFIALELIGGGDAELILSERHHLSEKELIPMMRDVALALAHASEHGAVHRDIKPGNLLFDKENRVKLSDFGLVKCAKDFEDQTWGIHRGAGRLTQMGQTVGTAEYIAPEQAQGADDLDIRADIYSLGATFYHLATGQAPFTGESAVDIMTKHVHEELVPPDFVNCDLSPGCSAIIVKMMAKNRSNRYGSPLELACDLDCLLRGQKPVIAYIKTHQPSERRVSPLSKRKMRTDHPSAPLPATGIEEVDHSEVSKSSTSTLPVNKPLTKVVSGLGSAARSVYGMFSSDKSASSRRSNNDDTKGT